MGILRFSNAAGLDYVPSEQKGRENGFLPRAVHDANRRAPGAGPGHTLVRSPQQAGHSAPQHRGGCTANGEHVPGTGVLERPGSGHESE